MLRPRQAAAAEQARDAAEAGIGLELDGSPDYTRAARGLGALRAGEEVAPEDRADTLAALLEWCNGESDDLEDGRVPADVRRVARETLDAGCALWVRLLRAWN
jgi:hypothetical protein